MRKIKIGTRASRLALWQAEFVTKELKKIFPTIGVKALFTDEVNSIAQN